MSCLIKDMVLQDSFVELQRQIQLYHLKPDILVRGLCVATQSFTFHCLHVLHFQIVCENTQQLALAFLQKNRKLHQGFFFTSLTGWTTWELPARMGRKPL